MTDNRFISQAESCDASDASSEMLSEVSVIKALEIHGNDETNDCTGCPYLKGDCCTGFAVYSKAYRDVLDLINRQKAENKELWEERNRIYDSLKDTKAELEECRKAYLNAQAEIERLQLTNNRLKGDIEHTLDNQMKLIKISKSEGRKEFAERLKTLLYMPDNRVVRRTVYTDEIDNLVKEMVGE